MPTSSSQALAALTRAAQDPTSQHAWLNVSRPLEAEDLQGRILVIGFWTSTSLASIQALEELARLSREHGPELCVIGVHSPRADAERDPEVVLRAVQRHGLAMPIVLDPELALWRFFRVATLGTRIVIGPTGAIGGEYASREGLAELKEELAELRGEHESSLNRLPLLTEIPRPSEGESALFFPEKLAWDSDRKLLWIADTGHHRIVGVTLEGEIRHVIGALGASGARDGAFADARFSRPRGLLYSMVWKDRLFIADSGNHMLKVADLREQSVRTVAGTGAAGQERDPRGSPALKTPLNAPWDLALSPMTTQEVVIVAAGANQLWAYDPLKKTVRVIAGNGRELCEDGETPANSLAQPQGVFASGERLFVVETASSALRTLEGTMLSTLMGRGLSSHGLKDGPREEALLQHPTGVYADPSGAYVADTLNHAIRRFDPFVNQLETIAGSGEAGYQDGPLAQARFCEPTAVLRVGGMFFIADSGNHRVRALDPVKLTVETFF